MFATIYFREFILNSVSHAEALFFFFFTVMEEYLVIQNMLSLNIETVNINLSCTSNYFKRHTKRIFLLIIDFELKKITEVYKRAVIGRELQT